LLTDFPAGADPEIEALVAASPLVWIRLIAPTTSPERLTRAVRGASGFLYLISRLGVTGARDQVPPDLAGHVARVRAASPLPLAVGFGIATPAQARATAALADGVVVGSAIVEALGRDGLGAAERLVRAVAGGVLAADWLWQKKMFRAALVNLGREVVALVGAYGIYAGALRVSEVTAPGLHVELVPALFFYALAYFVISRLLFYFALIIRGKLEQDERLLILRYECIGYGASLIATGIIVGTVAYWPPLAWVFVAAALGA